MGQLQFRDPASCLPRIVGGVVLLACLAAIGCGGGSTAVSTGSITGKVTFEGEPVTEGEVNFVSPQEGYADSAVLDGSGSFSIESLQVGSYTVYVTPPAITEAPSVDPSELEPPKEYDNIPDGYQSEMTSDLTAEVKEGENNFTFDMKPGGGAPGAETGAEEAP